MYAKQFNPIILVVDKSSTHESDDGSAVGAVPWTPSPLRETLPFPRRARLADIALLCSLGGVGRAAWAARSLRSPPEQIPGSVAIELPVMRWVSSSSVSSMHSQASWHRHSPCDVQSTATTSEPKSAWHCAQQSSTSDVEPTNSSRSEEHLPRPLPQYVYEPSVVLESRLASPTVMQ